MSLKSSFRSLVRSFGYDLRRVERRGWQATYLRALSDASLIVDIGVGTGTPKLYEAFSGRTFVLIEPLVEHEVHLEKWKKRLGAHVLPVAAGAVDGHAEITIDPRRLSMSSLVRRSKLTQSADEGELRVIPIRRLDGLLSEFSGEHDTYLIKIDVEGAELNVLKGGVESLQKTDLLIVETSVADLYDGDAHFLSIVNFMDTQGFRLFDILHLAYYKDWKGLMWLDLVFVPKTNASQIHVDRQRT